MKIASVFAQVLLLLSLLSLAFIFISGCNTTVGDLPELGLVTFLNPDHIRAGQPLVWQLEYQVGSKRIDPKGELLLRFPHPYYNTRPENWVPEPDVNGNLPIKVKTSSKKPVTVSISNKGWHRGTISIRGPEGFKPGDKVSITLGKKSGPDACYAPVYQISSFKFILLADSKGTGKFDRVTSSNTLSIVPDDPVSMELIAPSQSQSSQMPTITCRLLDRFGNISPARKKINVEISSGAKTDSENPVRIVFAPGDNGWKQVKGPKLSGDGIKRLTAFSPELKQTVLSNPIRVNLSETKNKWYWGDLQGHSAISDGTGTGEEYYEWAQGPAALDFASLTDHEWQIDQDEWVQIKTLCENLDSSDSFVALLSWEFSLGGHRVVYYKDCQTDPEAFFEGPKEFWEVEYNNAPINSWSKNQDGKPLTDFGDSAQLMRSLSGKQAMVIPHTSATKDMGNDWDTHDPTLTRLVEIYSAHGSDESDDALRKVHGWVSKGSVQRALGRGYKLGFIASSDNHDGKPGKCVWGAYTGGLTALKAKELTRESVWQAMDDRNVYATTGPRILLDFQVGGKAMGQTFRSKAPIDIHIGVHATGSIDRAEVISNGEVIRSFSPGTMDFQTDFKQENFSGQAYYYLRIIQSDGEMAWSTPIWVVDEKTPIVENLAAVATKDGNRISWEADLPLTGGNYELYARRGNDGGELTENYMKIADITATNGAQHYPDLFANPTGITAYYILRWVPLIGKPVRLGLVSAQRHALNELGPEGVTINYYVANKGRADVVIYNLANRVVRRLTKDELAVGIHQVTWDGLDQNGQRCFGLHLFEIHSGGFVTQHKPIRILPMDNLVR